MKHHLLLCVAVAVTCCFLRTESFQQSASYPWPTVSQCCIESDKCDKIETCLHVFVSRNNPDL